MMSSELEKFELKQCKEQLKMIESFLPESFMKRGGKKLLDWRFLQFIYFS